MTTEFTERHPVVAWLKDGPWQQRFRAADVINCHAQQVLHCRYRRLQYE